MAPGIITAVHSQSTSSLTSTHQPDGASGSVQPLVSLVVPCLNEAKTLPLVIERAKAALSRFNLDGEIVVADNGSTDDSRDIAVNLGARVVAVPARGYGSALTGGIKAARGNLIIFADADNTYDFMEISPFVQALSEGNDFVIGTRLKGTIEKGAMPLLHRYLGTPVLTFLINHFFRTKISDCNCGFRALKTGVIDKLDIQSTGMEFASEMIIKAGLLHIKTAEVPVTLKVGESDRLPHLRTWRDGWRHLRFIIAYATDQILLVPGVISIALGTAVMILVGRGPVSIFGFHMDYHFLFPSALLIILGTQFISLTLMARTYTGLASYKPSRISDYLRVESTMILGVVLFLAGLARNLYILFEWHYGQELFAVRPGIIAMTLMATGAQIFSNAFFIGVLKIPKR